jgi:hypothetical protein
MGVAEVPQTEDHYGDVASTKFVGVSLSPAGAANLAEKKMPKDCRVRVPGRWTAAKDGGIVVEEQHGIGFKKGTKYCWIRKFDIEDYDEVGVKKRPAKKSKKA